MPATWPRELRKVLRLLSRGEKARMAALCLMMLLAAAMEVVGVGLVPAFVVAVANPARVLEHRLAGPWLARWAVTTPRGLLLFGSAALLALFAVKNAYLVGFWYYQTGFLQQLLFSLRGRLMAAYLRAPYALYLQRHTAELLRNVTDEVERVVSYVLEPLLIMARDAVLGLAVLVFLVAMEPCITLLVVGGLGGGAVTFLAITQRRTRLAGRKAQQGRREMFRTAAEAFGGIKEARVMHREGYFFEAFRRAAQGVSRLQRRRAFYAELPQPTIESFAVAAVVAMGLVLYGQARPIAHVIPIMAMFGAAIARLLPWARSFTRMATQLAYGVASVTPVHDDIAALCPPASREDAGDRAERLPVQHAIEVREVYFRYPQRASDALAGVSLVVPSGQAIGLVGPSGAGKTTLADVLLGLLMPQRGDVLVDGQSIFGRLSAWQRNLGYIPQHIFLCDDTLRRNIAFGVPEEEVDEVRLRRAVEQAQLQEFVASLPQGLNTPIGERGARLSGGQRQRIGIARALYHDPQVLVMDEATSALDLPTEEQILEALFALRGNRTLIIIAHRLSTIRRCDRVFLMQEGRIADAGTYAELFERSEVFRRMAVGTAGGAGPRHEGSSAGPA